MSLSRSSRLDLIRFDLSSSSLYDIMMYELIMTLTGEVFITDNPKEVLDEYPLLTLRDEETLDTLIEEDLDSWLTERSTTLHLVYNPKTLSTLSDITDFEQAITLIDSKYWNGCCYRIGERLLARTDVFEKILSCPQWNGNISFFPCKYLNNMRYFNIISKNPRWNGCCLYLGEKIKKKKHIVLKYFFRKRCCYDCLIALCSVCHKFGIDEVKHLNPSTK